MKICITGGGNIAHAFIGELGKNTENEVFVLTRQPQNWNKKLQVFYNTEFHHIAENYNVTDDLLSLGDSDVIVITIPSHVRQEYLEKIKPYVSPNTLLIAVPATGGINFMLEEYFPNNKYACLQRTPYISRIMEYGHSVNMDVKKKVDVYFSKNCREKEVEILKSIVKMDVIKMESIWPQVLSNSNPILHMVSMYTLLNGDYPCDEIQFLYGNAWKESTSKLALEMDDELEKIMIKLNVSEFKTLRQHYEVKDYIELTNKLKSIPSFKTLLCPMIEQDGKYVIDKNSRYIYEDLPYGTCFIKLMGVLLGINTPCTDMIIRQIQPFMGIEFVDADGNFNLDLWQNFVGFDYVSRIKDLISV